MCFLLVLIDFLVKIGSKIPLLPRPRALWRDPGDPYTSPMQPGYRCMEDDKPAVCHLPCGTRAVELCREQRLGGSHRPLPLWGSFWGLL